MLNSEDTVRALREALRHSPDNLPLRQHLAGTLLSLGMLPEAEDEYRQALALAPTDQTLQLGLATALYQQGKSGDALTVVEALVRQSGAPGRAYLLHARLLYRAGDVQRAIRQYRQAVEFDLQAEDTEFAELLGIHAGGRPGDSYFDEVMDGKVRAAWGEDAPPSGAEMERPTVTFADVGGMESLKDEVRMKIVHPLTHPDLYRAYGKSIGGGILMYGPPGCGKTFLARATAGEVNAAFLPVGIHDVLEMWIGSSERNLHALFEQARRNRPCVLFFDEVDALGASRSDMRRSAGRQLINQFLAELDGVQSSNDGVLVLAATNAPWHLDAAFRRPGRFDRVLFVPPPDAAARAAILQLLCRGKPAADLDFEQLARRTDQFSGADLTAVVDLAVERKLQEAIRHGSMQPLTTKDLAAAAATVKPTTREWFSTARNYALYANQGGAYDDILTYLKLT